MKTTFLLDETQRKLLLSGMILAGLFFGWWLGLRVTDLAAPVTTLTIGWLALRLGGVVF